MVTVKQRRVTVRSLVQLVGSPWRRGAAAPPATAPPAAAPPAAAPPAAAPPAAAPPAAAPPAAAPPAAAPRILPRVDAVSGAGRSSSGAAHILFIAPSLDGSSGVGGGGCVWGQRRGGVAGSGGGWGQRRGGGRAAAGRWGWVGGQAAARRPVRGTANTICAAHCFVIAAARRRTCNCVSVGSPRPVNAAPDSEGRSSGRATPPGAHRVRGALCRRVERAGVCVCVYV